MRFVKTIVSVAILGISVLEAGNFSRLYGGEEDDIAYSIAKTKEGYVVAGKSESFSKHRDFDAYVVMIDKNGKKLWSKIYGGKDDDTARDITIVGEDTVFIGTSESFGSERNAIYTVRTDAKGSPKWQTIYFRDEDDEYFGRAVCTKGQRLFFGGYDRHLGFFDEERDIYLYETDELGDMRGLFCIATKEEESLNDMVCTQDGFVITGMSDNFGDDDGDLYLAKLDTHGKIVWQIAFGGTDEERGNAVVETSDGYVAVGSTESFGLNYKDIYVVKTDKKGRFLWQRRYGGSRDDEAFGAIALKDGSVVITGRSESFSRRKGFELYLAKIDRDGRLLWERTYGGEDDDAGYSLVQADDGGLVVVGERQHAVSRDSDLWILKTDKNGRYR